MKKKKLSGLIAAPYTGFHPDGSINLDIIDQYALHLKSSGVSGVFVNGTTGEGVSLTLNERKLTIESWVRHLSDDFKVLTHVGHDSINSMTELARHSEALGVDGIGMMGPPFFTPNRVEYLVEYCREVAQAAASVPFYYYHIPSMTGVSFNMIDFLEKAQGIIPNLAGIKYTHENLMDMRLCMDFEGGRYTILHGRDEILLAGLSLGVEGAIGSTYNYLAPLFMKLITAFEEGDLVKANELQLVAINIIRQLIVFGGGVKAGKAMMKLVGLDLGGNRLPVQSIEKEKEQEFFKILQSLDIEEHIQSSNNTI